MLKGAQAMTWTRQILTMIILMIGLTGLSAQTPTPWASGSSTLQYKQSGSGTYSTTQKEVNDRTVSVFNYMTQAQRADVAARTYQVDVTSALQAAITANYGGTLRLEPGVYRHTGLTITDSIRIIGPGWAFSMGAPNTWHCALLNVHASNPSITIGAGVFHQGVVLEHFGIIGSGSGTATPNGHTDDGIYFSGEGQHHFHHLQVSTCGGWGIRSYGVVDKTLISECKITKGSSGGVKLVDTKATSGQINHISVEKCEIDTNFGPGVQAFGAFINLRFNTIQGNTGYGINLTTDDATTPQIIQGLEIYNNYFENNGLGHIYGLAVSIARVANIWDVHIVGNQFNNNVNVPDIKLTASDGTAAYHPWRGCRIIGNTHKTGTSRVWADFDSQHGHTTFFVPDQLISNTFSTRYVNLSTSASNAINIPQFEGRFYAGPDQLNADYIGQISYDTVNGLQMKAISVGSGYADWRPLTEYIGSAAPTKGVFRRGQKFWNSAAASGAAPYWIQTTASGSGSYGSTRANTTAYTTSSNWVTWGAGTTVYECTTAGTTAGSEPAAASAVGQTVTDGTVVWTCRALTRAVWTAAANLP